MRDRGGARAGALALALVLIAAIDSAVAGDRVPQRATPASVEGRFQAVGAGRCSATACHGSPRPVSGSRILRDEHTTWADRDPHAQAYRVLHSSWSRSIAAKLGRGRSAVVPAHRDGRCLACHATPGPAADPALAAVIRQDGVGCESCHGAAGTWLALHNTYDWDGLAPHEKARYGMVPAGDLTRRAEACARCHVGEPGRDVDHDLIAAGHPRLAFEFSAYLANMPAHWVETGRNAAGDFPARAWAIGQAVSARASLELLEGRARAAERLRDRWPEFSEYDCASCHHDLRAAPARAATGRPAWGTWPYPMLATLADGRDGTAAQAVRVVGLLERSMSEPLPEPRKVAGEASEAASAVSRWLASLQDESYDPARTLALVRSIRSTEPETNGGDRETQEYLALVPLRQALRGPDRDRAGLLQEIHSRRRRLQLPFAAEPLGASGPSR